MLPPVLMAYREREEGGLLGGFPVSGCAGVAALFTSFSLSILGPSIPVAFAAAGSGSRSLTTPCSCMLACVGIPLALFVPSGLWFVCLVAAVCSPVACGSRLSVSRGWAPFIPSLLPAWAARSVFPHTTHVPFLGVGGLLFFTCSLAASTFSLGLVASSCVGGLWKEGGGWFSWTFFCLGPSILVAFAAAGSGLCSLTIPCLCLLAREGIRLWLFLCPRVCGWCVWWRWCALRQRVAPFPRFRGGSLHTITSFRLGCPLGIPSYHPWSVPRCWRPLVLRVFFGGVHIFVGGGGL